MGKCKYNGCWYSYGEMLFVISYEYTMYSDYENITDDNGFDLCGVVTATAVDEASCISDFKRHFTMNIDRFCPFDTVNFDIVEAKRIMIQ